LYLYLVESISGTRRCIANTKTRKGYEIVKMKKKNTTRIGIKKKLLKFSANTKWMDNWQKLDYGIATIHVSSFIHLHSIDIVFRVFRIMQ